MEKMKVQHFKFKIGEISPNPDNPRVIKDHRFRLLVKSIVDFPEMLGFREVVVDENKVILGGNMRYKACVEAGVKELTVTMISGLDAKRKAEFIIKDNANYGVWDWDSLANNWTDSALNDWGLNVWTPTIEDSFDASTEIDTSTPDGSGSSSEEKERKKVIPIEFNIEDYDEANELYQKMKKANVDIAAVFTQKLSEELCTL